MLLLLQRRSQCGLSGKVALPGALVSSASWLSVISLGLQRDSHFLGIKVHLNNEAMVCSK